MNTDSGDPTLTEIEVIEAEKEMLSHARVRRLNSNLSIEELISQREKELGEKLSEGEKRSAKFEIINEAPWCGLALSGGGIRSATFCLGILQVLAKYNLLRNFDYISSVSGGGFIASSLQWWWYKSKNGNGGRLPLDALSRDGFAYGTDHPNPELSANADSDIQKKQLINLRDYGNYLTPGGKINVWYGLSALMRAVLLNLIIWIPLIGAFYWAITYVGYRLRPDLTKTASSDAGVPYGLASKFKDYVESMGLSILSVDRQTALTDMPFSYNVLIVFAILFLFFSIVVSAAYSLQTWTEKEGAMGQQRYWRNSGVLEIIIYAICVAASLAMAVFLNLPSEAPYFEEYFKEAAAIPFVSAVPLVLLFISVVFLAKWLILWMKLPERIGAGYYLRDKIDSFFGQYLPVGVLIVLVCLVPIFVHQYLMEKGEHGFTAQSFLSALFSVVAGGATIFGAYGRLYQKSAVGIATRILLPIGAALFLFGIATFGYYYALMLFSPKEFLGLTESEGVGNVRFILVTLIIVAILLARFANLNRVGLNRFYRDRLMEAYMPNNSTEENIRKRDLSQADSLYLYELLNKDPRESVPQQGGGDQLPDSGSKSLKVFWKLPLFGRVASYMARSSVVESSEWNGGPYPLINANVVLVNDDEPKYRRRGGDNFLFSPAFCGSKATHWTRADTEILEGVTLATAMTASGAAVNPFTGYIGMGPTRGRVVSIVMALLNLRLGFWLRNPRCYTRSIYQKLLGVRPNHILPGFSYTLTRNGHRKDSSFLEITDGAHFDGLGIYELIRRRCNLIVVCDGEADKESSYRSLVSLVQRIKEDLNAIIVLDEDKGPERLVEKELLDYPSGVVAADHSFFVATIKYLEPGQREGKLIYMKARMIKEVSFQVKGYKGGHPDFPHESTSDQFFEPAQFEAYRELGYCTGSRMVEALGLDKNDAIFKNLGALAALANPRTGRSRIRVGINVRPMIWRHVREQAR